MLEHPYIDFNGDGHGDRYYAENGGKSNTYYHVDGHGHVDAEAIDVNRDGRIDQMFVDHNHNGVWDTELTDTDGDGIMDTSSPYVR